MSPSPGKKKQGSLALLLLSWATFSGHVSSDFSDVFRHERELDQLFKRGNARGVISYARTVLDGVPSHERNSTAYGGIYKFLGAGHHSLGELEEATQAFQLAVSVNSYDLQNWILLGDTLLHQMRAEEAAQVYEEAIMVRHLSDDVSKLYKARQWTADWRGYDDLQARIKSFIKTNVEAGRPPGVSSAEFTLVDPATLLSILKHQPNAQEASGVAMTRYSSWQLHREGRHRVGFLTSDLGVHPVSSLIRGLVTMLDQQRYEVHVYCLTQADSWWRRNISRGVEHFHTLHGLSTEESAAVMHGHGLHTLIDLNGHTMHSGLPILSLTPAPVQLSFLGNPMSTGAAFVDWLVGDSVVLDPATAPPHQAEKLLLLPPSYLVNDHAQLMGHVITRAPRPPRPSFNNRTGPPPSFIFGALSNFQKMDPQTFTVWANILRRVPSSRLDVVQYRLHEVAGPNLISEAMARGLYPTRLAFRPQEPWIEHVWSKTDVSLALDTMVKNGHTTDLDALWAGVPLVTMPGDRMENRAGASVSEGLGMANLVVYSAKEYEDLAVALAKDPETYAAVRREVEERRVEGRLFDTRSWANAMQAGLDAASEVKAVVGQAWHVWTPPSGDPTKPLTLGSALAEGEQEEAEEGRRQTARPRKTAQPGPSPPSVLLLHIGGMVRHDDWTVVNVQPGPVVDIVAPMHHIPGVGNSSVTAIYASHCLEHASYGEGDASLSRTLAEWHRVLKNGGMALISVPDLRVLSTLFVNDTLTLQQRFHVMRMMFGGQTDPHDYHHVGLDQDILAYYLTKAGFCEIKRVERFGIFQDASDLLFAGQAISLNVMAAACKGSEEPRVTINIAQARGGSGGGSGGAPVESRITEERRAREAPRRPKKTRRRRGKD